MTKLLRGEVSEAKLGPEAISPGGVDDETVAATETIQQGEGDE